METVQASHTGSSKAPPPLKPAWGSIRFDEKQWNNPLWRLSNLYKIINDAGQAIWFKPNDVQLRGYADLWYLMAILKSRQHGWTTWLVLIILDQCVFRSNISGGVIAHTLADAQKIFRNKVQYPYKHLPLAVQQSNPLVNDSQSEFVLANGSQLSVGTSYRSGTLQFVLVSEFGKISRRYPEKAVEIVTGSFNTAAPGQHIWVESTAEGRGGAFYELIKQARALREVNAKLTPLDFHFAFYAWWEKRGNTIDPAGVHISKEMTAYFNETEGKLGIKLQPGQRAWYVKKRQQMLLAGGRGTIDGDALMKREHPSSPDEAFEAAVEGSYYAAELAAMRKSGRLCKLPVERSIPVNTLWDIGKKDRTAIWFHQRVGPENRLIDYYENSGKEIEHYSEKLEELQRERGYLYHGGKLYLPHDARNKVALSPKSYEDRLYDLQWRNTVIVPKVEHLGIGIQAMRSSFGTLWMDPERCDVGLVHLENYRKAWNDSVADWYDYPVDDESTHCADALRQGAQIGLFVKAAGVVRGQPRESDRGQQTRARRVRSWRTA